MSQRQIEDGLEAFAQAAIAAKSLSGRVAKLASISFLVMRTGRPLRHTRSYNGDTSASAPAFAHASYLAE